MTCVLPHRLTVSCAFDGDEKPLSSSDIILGGRAKSAIVFDCDGRWKMSRLHAIISSYISSKLSQAFTPDAQENQATSDALRQLVFSPSVSDMVTDSLTRLHIFRPTSSLSLAATLLSLPTYHQQKMQGEEMLMLFIDSLSAFYHADKWKTEQAAVAENSARATQSGAKHPPAAGSTTLPPLPRVDTDAMTHVISTLQHLRRTLGIITFITNWALITPDGRNVVTLQPDVSAPWFGQHLPLPYPSIRPPSSSRPADNHLNSSKLPITHHITLPGAVYSIPQYSVGVTFEQALDDEERYAAVTERKVLALVRTPVPLKKRGDADTQTAEKNSQRGMVRDDGFAEGAFEFSIRGSVIGVQ